MADGTFILFIQLLIDIWKVTRNYETAKMAGNNLANHSWFYWFQHEEKGAPLER